MSDSKKDFIPFVIGAIIGGLVIPILWSQNIIPQWSLIIGIVPLIIGGFITTILRQLEYKPGEPSYKCKCGYDIYYSSKDEHDKVCEANRK
jgi:hypothetical protein